jgi:prephenate dehydratase
MVTFQGNFSRVLKASQPALTTDLDIFNAIQSGNVSRAVLPVENSTNGSVVGALDLLADRSKLYPDILVCGEVYVDVHHYLFGSRIQTPDLNKSPVVPITSIPMSTIPEPLKPRTSPLAGLEHIERIYSHPQVWGQCELFLGAYLKGIERKDATSTSQAAEQVKADMTGKSAAISSQQAGDHCGLVVLGKRIEDKDNNTTKFFILQRNFKTAQPKVNGQETLKRSQCKSLVSFTVDHESPGALANVLDCFRQHKLNLTSINSRPSGVVPFQYIFFVEFEGSKLYDPEGNVNEALSNVRKVAKSSRWLGSWEVKVRL